MCEDEQVPGTDYVMYADIVGETLLKELRLKVQEETNFGRVIENYSFVRITKEVTSLKNIQIEKLVSYQLHFLSVEITGLYL